MKKLHSFLTRFLFAFAVVLPLVALAQSTTDIDPVGMLSAGVKTLADSAQAKNWALFIPTLIILIVTAVRWAGGKVSAEGSGFRNFLDNKWTKWGMNFITTLSGAFVSAATAHVAITANLVVNSLLMAFAAAGGVEFFRDIVASVSKDKAVAAGTAATTDPGKTLNG